MIHTGANVIRNSSEPLYEQLYRFLLEEILCGHIPAGGKLPGMTQLARTYGVSTITVNQALDKLIEDGYCLRRPKKGTFVTDCRNPVRREKSGTIILFSTSVNSEIYLVDTPFYTHLRHTAENFPQANLLVISGPQAFSQLTEQLDHNRSIIGVIIIAINVFERLLELVGNYPGLPFVLLNYQYPEFEKIAPANLRGVFNDEFSGGYTAASELFARGAKEIGVIQYGVGDSNYRLRLQGFLQAHVDHGFVFKETNLCNIDSVLPPMERGYNGMGVLLSRNPRLDAVFCINDILAVGAVRFLKLSPAHHDLLIIGYDNHLPELHIANHFPTIAVNTAAMSSAAVRMLLTPELYHCKQLFISPRLVR